MTDNRSAKHDALLAVSPGYGEWSARSIEEEGDDLGVKGFVDWLLDFADEADLYADWTTNRFQAEYEAWNW